MQKETIYLMYQNTCIGEVSEYTDGSTDREYSITVYWDAWDSVGNPIIAGIDTDLRKDVYKRDYLPYLLSVKCPLYERDPKYKGHILWQLGMQDGTDYFGYIKRTRGINHVYDDFYFSEQPDDYLPKDINDITDLDIRGFIRAYNDKIRRRANDNNNTKNDK